MTGADDSNTLDHRDWGLTCAEFLELTTEYLEQALSNRDVARFEGHLAKCKGCTTILDQLRDQIAFTGRLREDDIAPETLADLLDAFGDWHSQPPGET